MSFRSSVAAVLFVLAGTSILPACSKQGEGERCEQLNGNDDCESPLLCKAIGNGEICCPENKANATTAACRGDTVTNSDGGTSADGASADTGDKSDTGATADGVSADTGGAADATDAGAADGATSIDASDASSSG